MSAALDPRELLAPGEAESAEAIQGCRTSLSPLGDVQVLARGLKVAFVRRRPRQPGARQAGPARVVDRGQSGVDLSDRVTAVLCLPFTDSRAQRGGREQRVGLVEHVAVLGYSSGAVEVLTEEGDCLARRVVLDSPVLAVRASVLSTVGVPRLDGTVPVDRIPPVSDVLVVYEATMVTLPGAKLYDKINSSKWVLAEAKAAGQKGLDQEVLADLFCKKFHFRDQAATDACILRCPNRDFDRLCHLSSDSKINESHFRSLSTLTYIASAGFDPWLQYNLPYNYKVPPINEIAENMVSTVKSGLFRAATGMFFGGSAEKKEEEKPRDPEQKLVVAHQLIDPSKAATAVEISPNNMYLAVVDNQNRVMAVDALSGLILNVWKGYHHVQVGWLVVTSKDAPTDYCESFPADNRTCCLLVIYLPRRGSLQVCSPERKAQIAEFAVCKRGRLVPGQNGILDPSCKAVFARVGPSCVFMDGEGRLMRIRVPFHSIMTRSGASHDLVQQQRLNHLLAHAGDERETLLREVVDLVAAAKTQFGRATMIMDFLKEGNSSTGEARSLLSSLARSAQTADASASDKSPFALFTAQVEKALHFSDLLENNCFERQDKEQESPENGDAFKWPKTKAGNEPSTITLQTLLSWIVIDTDLAAYCTAPDGGIGRPTCRVREEKLPSSSALAILAPLAKASDKKVEELSRLLKDLHIRPTDLANLMVTSLPSLDKGSANRLSAFLRAAFVVMFDMPSVGEESMRRLQLFGQVREILAETAICPQLHLVLTSFHAFISNDMTLERLYSRDANKMLENCRSFLMLSDNLDNLLESKQREAMAWKEYTLQTVFDEGDGRISELISQWLVEKGFSAGDILHCPEVVAFVDACAALFPRSSRAKVMVAHMTWELARRWTQQRADVGLLESASEALDLLLNELEERRITHFVALLICRTFLSGPVREATTFVEQGYSASRCLRDLGVKPDDVPRMLLACSRFFRLVMNFDPGELYAASSAGAKESSFYDEGVSEERRRKHLLDHLRDPDGLGLGRGDGGGADDPESVALHYQFAVCCALVLRFSLDVRPLRLFSSQDSNRLLRNGGGAANALEASLNMGVMSVMQAGSVRKARFHLIRRGTAGAVSCIHYTGPDELDTKEFREWASKLLMLGKLWHLHDEVTGALIISLYREGHDGLTGELMHSSARQADIAEELLVVAMTRLSKHLHDSQNYRRVVTRVKEYLLDKLTVLKDEAATFPEVPLAKTESLLVRVCNSGISEGNARVAEDCLALTRMFAAK